MFHCIVMIPISSILGQCVDEGVMGGLPLDFV
jgi:hypothetical protein